VIRRGRAVFWALYPRNGGERAQFMVFESPDPIAPRSLINGVAALFIHNSSMVNNLGYRTICMCEWARTLLKMPKW
jgi:hypothetical protein